MAGMFMLVLSLVLTAVQNALPSVAQPESFPGRGNKVEYHYHEAPPCTCNCHCETIENKADHCEWKRVFKAVQGNGRHVYRDFLTGGAINAEDPRAKDISSSLPFRDADILDNWCKLNIRKVQIEVFESGVRKTWLTFNATLPDMKSWLSRDTLVASPYADITAPPYDKVGYFFSVDGHDIVTRRFFINRNYNGCPADCGYLAVVDPDGDPEKICPWDNLAEKPFFWYGKLLDKCSRLQTRGEGGIGDRFVISVKVCGKN
ncbi:uncharacterized protein LOC135464028 [Liolophura sinensis]|uniref:uncharacterized protein LOC135464028 n=1 Tax=Liolophura sinensis TaxID=3198878 RepID=UPI0031594D21